MTITAALELMLQGMATAQQVGMMIARAQSQGRTEITDEDMASVVGADDQARTRLVAAIAAAKADGR